MSARNLFPDIVKMALNISGVLIDIYFSIFSNDYMREFIVRVGKENFLVLFALIIGFKL